MVALYTVFYNFCRIHRTLRVTPAMEAGLTDHVWDMEDVVAVMDERAPKPGRPKTYKKTIQNDALPIGFLAPWVALDTARAASRPRRPAVSARP